MIRRHPHIFGDKTVETIEDLNDVWKNAKAKEGKIPRVKFEKVFADHFMTLYDNRRIILAFKLSITSLISIYPSFLPILA
jgi:uncharacterized protein YabN with tetrapyrrole methylase and pyrophosphatase domain